jgi:hypothetical protein
MASMNSNVNNWLNTHVGTISQDSVTPEAGSIALFPIEAKPLALSRVGLTAAGFASTVLSGHFVCSQFLFAAIPMFYTPRHSPVARGVINTS